MGSGDSGSVAVGRRWVGGATEDQLKKFDEIRYNELCILLFIKYDRKNKVCRKKEGG